MLDLYYLTFADISKMSTFKYKQYRSPLSGLHMHVTKDVDGVRSNVSEMESNSRVAVGILSCLFCSVTWYTICTCWSAHRTKWSHLYRSP